MLEIQFARFDDINSLLIIPVHIVDGYMTFDASGIAAAIPEFVPEVEDKAYFIQECVLLAFHEGNDTHYEFDDGEWVIAEASFLIDGEPVTALQLADHLHNLEV